MAARQHQQQQLRNAGIGFFGADPVVANGNGGIRFVNRVAEEPMQDGENNR